MCRVSAAGPPAASAHTVRPHGQGPCYTWLAKSGCTLPPCSCRPAGFAPNSSGMHHLACNILLYCKALWGLGRLWSVQGLPSTMPHSMVEQPHGVDFFFSFLLYCMPHSRATGLLHVFHQIGMCPCSMRLDPEGVCTQHSACFCDCCRDCGPTYIHGVSCYAAGPFIGL